MEHCAAGLVERGLLHYVLAAVLAAVSKSRHDLFGRSMPLALNRHAGSAARAAATAASMSTVAESATAPITFP